MKLVRILVLAACAAYGAIIGGATLAQAAPMTGVSLAAPAVRTLETPAVGAFPVEKTYWYYRRWHYYHPYYHRWHRWHYYHPYYHRWHRWHRWHRYYW